MINLYLEATNVDEIDNYLEENQIAGINYEKQNNSNDSKRTIMEIFLYSFMILIGICTFLNIFNSIFSNIISRRKEFMALKTLGMTKKQFNKMLRFETLYYSIISLVIGIILGIIIFVIIYKIEYQLNNKFLYNLYISWQSILTCIICVLVSMLVINSISKFVLKIYTDK